MVAAYILLLGICGAMALFTNAMAYSKDSWEMTSATTHAESILEEMQNRNTLGEVLVTNWDKWARDQYLATLPEESFAVSFADRDANPLDIKVTVSWKSRTAASQQITLNTRLTR
jgi:hypothetical protein